MWVVQGTYRGRPQIYALRTTCTHLGCITLWQESQQKFQCPCHGSGFTKEGINVEGPPRRPLERCAIRIADDGQLEIDRSRTFQAGAGPVGRPGELRRGLSTQGCEARERLSHAFIRLMPDPCTHDLDSVGKFAARSSGKASSATRRRWIAAAASLVMLGNFVLHLHPASIKTHALRPSFTWCMGAITFFLFLVETVTGVLLMFYYRPTVEWAYHDMLDLRDVVSLGRLREIHRWGGHAMVIAVMLHMYRVFLTGSYKPPREFNWCIGVLLLVLTLLFSFTGYLLPWDQLSMWAVTVGANLAGDARCCCWGPARWAKRRLIASTCCTAWVCRWWRSC